MAEHDDFDAESILKEGRNAYTQKRYKKALECFTRVMRRCRCNRGQKRERCRCKDFEAVAERRGSIFHEAMYTCSCTVGKTFNKCDASNHIRALDYRAANFEAMGELERSKLDAEWLLELAPRLPEGYLRLGKIARLQKKNELAWHVYNAGIEATESSPRSSLIEKLHQARQPLNRRFARRDPLSLPMEVLQMIFQRLDFATLVSCAQVCKRWESSLTSGINRPLWRTVHFDGRCKNVTIKALSRILKYANYEARGLIVEDCKRAGFTREKLRAVMLASKNLEVLELHRPSEAMSLFEDGAVKPGRKLQHVVLDGFSKEIDNLNTTLTWVLTTLTQLHHLDINNGQDPLFIPTNGLHHPAPRPVLSHLRYLRVAPQTKHVINFTELARISPNLEQVWLECGSLRPFMFSIPWVPLWPKLKALVFKCQPETGWDVVHQRDITLRLLEQPEWQAKLRYLDLEVGGESDHRSPFDFPRLEALRLKGFMLKGREVEEGLDPASSQGDSLHTFTIQFPELDFSQAQGSQCRSHLADFTFLCGSPSIKHLILRRFAFQRWEDPETGQLPTFLITFPNLETLSLLGTFYEEAELCSVIEGIMKVCKGLKTVWQDQVTGVMMDRLRELGKREGVEVKSGEMPREWPVPLNDK